MSPIAAQMERSESSERQALIGRQTKFRQTVRCKQKMIPSKGTIIEGIGDEILYCLLLSTVTLSTIGVSVFYWLV